MIDRLGATTAPISRSATARGRSAALSGLPMLGLLLAGMPGDAVTQTPRERTLARADSLAEPFSRVRGLRELADGRVLVADQGEVAVYLLDPRTGTRVQRGQEGPGPEEYAMPIGLSWFPGDSSLLVDLGNGRVNVLDHEGDIARSFASNRFGLNIRYPQATVDGHIVFMASQGGANAIFRWDPITDGLDTLAALAGYQTFRDRGRDRLLPWSTGDLWSVGRDGRVAVVREDPYTIEWIEPDHSRSVHPVTAFRPIVVSRADRAAWEARPRIGGVARVGGAATPPQINWEFPRHFAPPVFRGATVAPDGTLWVQRQQSVRETRPLFDVFNPNGFLRERVRLPAGRAVVGFGDGVVYAVVEDELGLQYLERYHS